MTTTTKLVGAALLAGGLLATAGFGLTQGGGPPVAVKPAEPKPAMTDQAVRAALAKPIRAGNLEGLTIDTLLQRIESETEIIIRLDLAAYKRVHFSTDEGLESPGVMLKKFLGTELVGRFSSRLPLSDLMDDVCAQLPGHHSYRVRNGQILIGPAFLPPTIPGRVVDDNDFLDVDTRRISEQIHGEPVRLSIVETPFPDAIKELQRLTGANIVVNIAADKAKDKPTLVTVSFDDVRLYTALEILGDMAGLKLVFVHNVYYLTSPENAEKMQKKANEELFGNRPPTVPKGYLTDGTVYYRNPGNLKPEAPPNVGMIMGCFGPIPRHVK